MELLFPTIIFFWTSAFLLLFFLRLTHSCLCVCVLFGFVLFALFLKKNIVLIIDLLSFFLKKMIVLISDFFNKR